MYSDARKILPFLKGRKIKLALATNSYRSTKQIIDYFGLSRYFDYIAISCSIGISKVNPKLYLLIANKFSLKPSQILCVGDSYPTDIMGARKAGCGAAIIYRKKARAKNKYDCIYLSNLSQIKNLLS
ncbi:MAG: HAD family hydrolase [Candidatus Liptonbacteria bacterium]|nr:HAD family hydrolase [Candidatus Liptonbacteria bacterium]